MTETKACAQCAHWQREAIKWQEQARKLERRLRIAMKVIKNQHKQLKTARLKCLQIIGEARRRKAAGNLPRAVASRLTGREEAAGWVYAIIAKRWTDLLDWIALK